MEKVFDPNTHEEFVPSDETEFSEDTSQEEEVTMTLSLHRHYREAQDEWGDRASENKDYAHGYQFTSEQIDTLSSRGQAAVPINVIYPAMELSISLLTGRSPAFQTTAREDSDVKTARAISDLMSYVWQGSYGNSHLKESLSDYFMTGRGFLMAYVDPESDYNRGDVRITAVDTLKVLPDPNSRDRFFRDAAHVLVEHLMTGEQVLSMWPDARDTLSRALTTHDDIEEFVSTKVDDMSRTRDRVYDNHHRRYVVIDRYSKVKVDYIHYTMPDGEEKVALDDEFEQLMESAAYVLFDPNSGQKQIFAGDKAKDGKYLFDQGVKQEDGTLSLVEIPPQQDPNTGAMMPMQPIQVAMVPHSLLLEQGVIKAKNVRLPRIKHVIIIGGQLYRSYYLPIDEYPIVPILARHDRDPYPMSDIDFVRPFQDSINKLHMQLVANLANSTNVKVFLPRGSVDKRVVEQDFAKAGSAIIEYDAEMGQPTVVSPLAPPAGLFSHFQLLISMVERELGVYAIQQGDPSQAPDTYRGTLSIEEYGQRRIKSKLDDVEGSLTQLGKVVLQLIPYVYDEERTIRLLQPNNIMKETVLNQAIANEFGTVVEKVNDVSVGQYDVQVVSGSILPTNRYALLEYYMQLYQMGIIDQVEILKKTDVADADGVMERVGMIRNLQGQLAQAQEEIKRLQGDLQTSDREAIQARKRVEVEKFGSQLDKLKNKAEAATIINEQRNRNQQ
jgi:hypothetical protein